MPIFTILAYCHALIVMSLFNCRRCFVQSIYRDNNYYKHFIGIANILRKRAQIRFKVRERIYFYKQIIVHHVYIYYLRAFGSLTAVFNGMTTRLQSGQCDHKCILYHQSCLDLVGRSLPVLNVKIYQIWQPNARK